MAGRGRVLSGSDCRRGHNLPDARQNRQGVAEAIDGGWGNLFFGGLELKVALAWCAVSIPILWGVWNTLLSTASLFR
ncbi:MFS transporter small subunit [Agrobacterium deltaense]|uniref:MFS transporter small subunit n=1 Tax=Agrobacterium deltaense TaxID=1183412 RepID=UPI003D9C47BB